MESEVQGLAVALIVAAGLGERLGASRPKALVELAGRPLWEWSLCTLRAAGIARIVIATPPVQESGRSADEPSIGSSFPPDVLPPDVVAVNGGATRSESVRLALAAAGVGRDTDLVLVHDAARPLLTVELVQATLAAAVGEDVDAAIAATPVTDTVKQADGGGVVTRTLDRAGLWAVQTPQVFRRAALERALDVPDEVLAQATDDAWLVERAGGRVVVVPAPKDNLKVTTPLDLELAELLLARRDSA
ncbi:MAG TPA: 2-C-methyl-D-erythritol 4-phosphate cytidylyltransferase [Solirubrobacteraceae bacterium]|nr:2-C-methyl-D-erythritol 4-phosphate cytidylyltransferase [Solirubrobacteraceae bacterium]